MQGYKKTVNGFPRPLLDLNAGSFAKVIDKAFGRSVNPTFDPYANSINYLTASYLIPYVGLTGYVGANPNLQDAISKWSIAYEKANEKVHPYGIRVSEFTNKISQLRNTRGNSVITNEGLAVPKEMNTQLHMTVTPEDCSWIGAVSGNQSVPGGFYPKGGDGQIARSHPHTA
ncbi:Desiccation-like protein [Citrus sinensis]|nr:Desiccation-like protein [Citrus sinensis]